MIEAFTSRSGRPSVRIDGIALHSSYDPVREAERFVEAELAKERPSTVLVLGEGLGYLADAVQRRHPGARLLLIRYTGGIPDLIGAGSWPSWHPGVLPGVAGFLRAHLGDLDVEGLRVVEWQPSARLFPEVSRQVNDAVRQVVQELNGSVVTTAAMGRLWIRNSIANFLGFDRVLSGSPCARDRPLLIAAPGPSLEDSASIIAEIRELVDLWALPSSAMCLNESRLIPDLLVMTDPGYYSMHHLHFAGSACPVAMPLSAARGLWSVPARAGQPAPRPLLLAQPGFLENQLLDAAGVKAPSIVPHGTVAATALALALSSTRGPIIVAGLDMCGRDIVSHARPGAFDLLLDLRASRTSPRHALSFDRASSQRMVALAGHPGLRTSPALSTYAGWFAGTDSIEPGRVHRLNPSPINMPAMRSIDAVALREVLRACRAAPGGPDLHEDPRYPDRPRRVSIVEAMLRGWLEPIDRMLRGSGALPAASSALLASLCFYIEPGFLIEARRHARMGRSREARDATQAMLESCALFLKALAAKVPHAA
jgi:hypothetical protein